MFFDIFKSLCDERRISCKRAVTEIGLSNSLSTKWKKTGATPQGDTLLRIAEYFGVSTDFLLGNTAHPNEYILTSDDYPDILRQLVGDKTRALVLTTDAECGYASPDELQKALVEAMKEKVVQFNPNDKNPLTEMMALLPRKMRNNRMSLYDAVKYISSDSGIMEMLMESGLNEFGELTIPTDAFDRAKDEYLSDMTVFDSKSSQKEKPTPVSESGLSEQFADLFSQLTPEQQEFVVSAMKGIKSKE